MSDLLNDLSTEVIEEVTEAFLNARRAGASKLAAYMIARARSAARRVGKEFRSRWSPYH